MTTFALPKLRLTKQSKNKRNKLSWFSYGMLYFIGFISLFPFY